jgi:hypothetical protein
LPAAIQSLLPFARPLPARLRSVRRPFHPSQGECAYRLPRNVQDRLAASLTGFRNRDSAYALATFLARFWSVPGRVGLAFPIDRRALADHPDLGLTEKRVRSAITTLEAVGFLERGISPSGSRYKATETGLHRKPILYVFGSDYAPAFLAANARARAARGGDRRARRPVAPAASPRPSVVLPEAQMLNGPKNRIQAEPLLIMGPLTQAEPQPPQTFTPLPRLSDAALKFFGKPRVV